MGLKGHEFQGHEERGDSIVLDAMRRTFGVAIADASVSENQKSNQNYTCHTNS